MNYRTIPVSGSMKLFVPMLLLAFAHPAVGQRNDSTLFFRANASITQNGFSFIPSFSLGKPALILEPAVGNKRLSFEPQLRFSLEGKPWSFIFIYRYKFRAGKRFQVTLGGHLPSIVFSTQSVIRNGVNENVLISNRYLAAELLPEYTVNGRLRVGLYLLRGHGFDQGGVRDSYFVGARTFISGIDVLPRISLRLTPQFYYLKTDDRDGVYVTNTLTVMVKGFPLSISNIVNQAIRSNVPGKDFDWNVSLNYMVDKSYTRR